MDSSDFKFCGVMALVILLAFLVMFGLMYVIVRGTNPHHCIALQNGEVFYDGPGYMLSCRSAGSATTCRVGVFKADKQITGSGIQVNCE